MWFDAWGTPPGPDEPIARDWGEMKVPTNLRTAGSNVDAAAVLPSILNHPLPATAKIRYVLTRLRGNKPTGAIQGNHAVKVVDLYGPGRAGRLVAGPTGWRVSRDD